jgi:hypothetical protein
MPDDETEPAPAAKVTPIRKAKKPSTPANWPRGPQEYELPSGALVKALRANLFVWVKTGQLPDDILSALRRATDNGDVTLEERTAAVEWQIAKCIVDPPVSLMPKEGCLCIDDIDDVDKNFLTTMLGIGLG